MLYETERTTPKTLRVRVEIGMECLGEKQLKSEALPRNGCALRNIGACCTSSVFGVVMNVQADEPECRCDCRFRIKDINDPKWVEPLGANREFESLLFPP